MCDSILPGPGEVSEHKGLNPFFMDAHMMVLLSGRERTAKQFSTLFHSAGFRLDNVIETTLAQCQLIEASKIGDNNLVS